MLVKNKKKIVCISLGVKKLQETDNFSFSLLISASPPCGRRGLSREYVLRIPSVS